MMSQKIPVAPTELRHSWQRYRAGLWAAKASSSSVNSVSTLPPEPCVYSGSVPCQLLSQLSALCPILPGLAFMSFHWRQCQLNSVDIADSGVSFLWTPSHHQWISLPAQISLLIRIRMTDVNSFFIRSISIDTSRVYSFSERPRNKLTLETLKIDKVENAVE